MMLDLAAMLIWMPKMARLWRDGVLRRDQT
jgi:hypothetical protein